MKVPTILEIYTTYSGWIFNNVVYEALKYGVFLFPFIFLIYSQMSESIRSSGFKANHSQALKTIESHFWEKLVVMLFFFVPFFPLNLSALSFDVPSTNYTSKTLPNVITVANDPTTYSDSLNQEVANQIVEYGAAKIPIGMDLIMRLSYGLNYVLTKNIIESNARNDLKAAEYAMNQFTINDPALNAEFNQFHGDCFIPARSKYIRWTSESRTFPPAAQKILDDSLSDTNQIYSRVFQLTPGLYAACPDSAICERTLQANKPVKGWVYNQSRDGYRDPSLGAVPGQPYCDEWWRDLRERIAADGSDLMTTWQKIKSGLNITIDGEEKDVLANKVIRNSYENSQENASLTIASLRPQDTNGKLDEVEQFFGAVGLAKTNIVEGIKKPITKNAVSIILSLIISIFIVFTPFLIVATGYSLSGLFKITAFLFTLIMAHSVISIVEFTMNSVYSAVYADKVGVIMSYVRVDTTTYRFIMNTAYIFSLFIYFSIMAIGFNSTSSIGSGMNSGTSGSKLHSPSARSVVRAGKGAAKVGVGAARVGVGAAKAGASKLAKK